MRRSFGRRVGAFVAVVLISPAIPAAAAKHHVLTIKKVRGPAVKVGSILKSSLRKGTRLRLVLGSRTLTCTNSSLVERVTRNPVAPGSATTSLTRLNFGSCSGSGGTVGITAGNLPYKVSISDATGFPIAVTGRGSSTPLQINLTLGGPTGTSSCAYVARSLAGNVLSKGKSTKFLHQPFKYGSGGTSCGTAGSFSATYGPVRDASVGRSLRVFVN